MTTERGPYARIAVLRPHDGDTVEFEAGYMGGGVVYHDNRVRVERIRREVI